MSSRQVHLSLVTFLLEVSLIDMQDSNGWTALMFAPFTGQTSGSIGCINVNLVNSDDHTALIIASSRVM